MKRSSSNKVASSKSSNGPQASIRKLASLYEADETGWLETTANLIQEKKYDLLDYTNLAEYLLDMARSDRRAVFHRLITLLVHLLKWDHQPNMRSRSWEITIRNQREDLSDELKSKTLRNHVLAVFARAYARARIQAAGETGLDEKQFPAECPWSIDQVLTSE